MPNGNTHPYSGSNPIPKVSDFLEETAEKANLSKDQEKKREEEARKVATRHPSAKDERKAIQKGLGSEGNGREVTDPTTGNNVLIEDVNKDFMENVERPDIVVPNANLPDKGGYDTTAGVQSSPTQPHDEYARKQDVTAPPEPIAPHSATDVPIHGEKTNVLFHPTPSLSLEHTVFKQVEKQSTLLCLGIFMSIILLGRFLLGSSVIGLLTTASLVSSAVYYWARNLAEEARNVDWDSEKRRGQTAAINLIPESVEWLNSLLGLGWNLVNPDMLSALADTLEDVMQASVPGVIQNVRVADISQGSNPIRILSLRALPEAEAGELKRSAMEAKVGKDGQEKLAEEEGGEVYNIECAFAYHAAPTEGRGVSSRSRNMHLELEFYAGIKGLVGVPIPIWVELKRLVGTVRMRLQLTPDPPFIETLTFTLMGIPQVSVSCIPMIERGINVLNLPLISQFVNASIATAANQYVAPKSMTLEIGKMLVGDDVKKEVEAVGVLWVRIWKAVGLSKQDKRGSSDPYITLAFSKYEKPMYSTRVIVDDLNPIWEESAALLVKADHIKANESLAVELWDSDRFTTDDMVGKIELPLQDLLLSPGRMHDQISKLSGTDSGTAMPGELYWSVGFFGKPEFRPALRTTGKDINLPPELRDRPELQDDRGQLDSSVEDAVMHTPPDPLYPSGVVSIIVHQVVNLEIWDLTGSYGKKSGGKEYEPGMETGETSQEEGGKLPSSYCTIALNDQLIYRTRTKVVSSKPIFNAGTERFIRDFKSAIVTVTARDQRHREHDPILGVVPLRISELLQTTSQVTRWYPLDGGIGFGRIRISILFRSVGLSLPERLMGWDVGTFEFTSENVVAEGFTSAGSGTKIKMRTGGSTGKIPRRNASAGENGQVTWTLEKKRGKKVRLPVKHRYMSPIVFDFYHTSAASSVKPKNSPDAHAVLWLDSLVDNAPTPVCIPIYKTKNPKRLLQNHLANTADAPDLDLEEVGTLNFEAKFKPGMDEDHERFATDNDARETFETWQACRGEGIRGDVVRKETNEVSETLQGQSVYEMKEDLVEYDKMSDEDKETESKRLTDKYGMDWNGVFEAVQKDLAPQQQHHHTRTPTTTTTATDYSLTSDDSDDSDSESDSDSSYHHVTTTDPPGPPSDADMQSHSPNPIKQVKGYRQNQKSMHRRHRGLMQWKPMQSIAFASNEAKFGVRKLKGKVSLKGREPDVETEV
ncbi:hypothetical protein L873DRAFT_1662648 [Choiromyces venosus 120613-1]|uniref:C2 domain-containing protein n=1 Tax=Choiromyces venosus 120613-1 TaxID=1336337 RepID=A0A3N4KHN0_9PEZI|nr:hypothetical protein L873DRAFT_1662648 [Choiromyces venosus 120613-1]